jgi:hypothetical protein
LDIQLGPKYTRALFNQKQKILTWGVEIEFIDEGIRVLGIPGVLAKDVNEGRWKKILLQFSTAERNECPSELMDMFCSKACRSVCSSYFIYDFRQSCSMISFQKMNASRLLVDWLDVHDLSSVLTDDHVLLQ